MDKKLILITLPEFFEGEAKIINDIFSEGLDILHLRKPNATAGEVRRLVEQVDRQFHDKIVLHSHYHLTETLGLRGVHLGVHRQLDDKKINAQLSFSCHKLDEVMAHKQSCAYVFLSPIFNSISKEGYASAFSLQTLWEARDEGVIDDKVIALGGITPETARIALDIGFGGVAVLGDVWLNENPIKRFLEYESCGAFSLH